MDMSQWETMLNYWASKANNENAAYLQAMAAEQSAAKGSGGGSGGGSSKSSSGELSNKENETLAKAAMAYWKKNPGIFLDSRTLDYYLNSKGYSDLQANTFKAYLEAYGATYQRQR